MAPCLNEINLLLLSMCSPYLKYVKCYVSTYALCLVSRKMRSLDEYAIGMVRTLSKLSRLSDCLFRSSLRLDLETFASWMWTIAAIIKLLSL